MVTAAGDSKVNIGLNLKFEAKAQKVLGYSQKGESGWEFSNKAVELIREYISLFPEICSGLDRSRGGGQSILLQLARRTLNWVDRFNASYRFLRFEESRCEVEGTQGLGCSEGCARL